MHDLGYPRPVLGAPLGSPENAWGVPRDVLWARGPPGKAPRPILAQFLLPGERPGNDFQPILHDLFRSETLLIHPPADLSYFAQSGPSAIGLSVPWPHLAQIWPSAWTLVPITRLGAGPIFPWVKIEFLDQNSGSNLLIKFCDRIS